MCGHSLMLTTRRHDQALEMLGRAVDAAPNDPDTLIWSVPTLAYVGRTDDAQEDKQDAQHMVGQRERGAGAGDGESITAAVASIQCCSGCCSAVVFRAACARERSQDCPGVCGIAPCTS